MTREGPDEAASATPVWLMVIALVLAVLAARALGGTAADFETLALGDQTAPVYGSLAGDKIFCGSIAEAPQCLDPARARNLARRVVWLGNSQLHAINQARPGDKTAPVLLADALRPEGYEVLGFSMPNATLSELMIAANFLENERRIDVLVVPLFLDDTRETRIREALRPAVETAGPKAALQQTATGRDAIAAMAQMAAADAPAQSASLTLQQRSENAITGLLEQCCALQTTREAARGQIEVQAFFLRNRLFNITAQTVRPIIPAAYRQNLGALEDIFRTAQRRSTRVIVYIPPLRQDVAPPYDPAQYKAFKAETRALAARYGVRWVDLDGLVPGQYWGTKAATRTGGAAELDFMHYQAPGHLRLAQAMRPLVEAALR